MKPLLVDAKLLLTALEDSSERKWYFDKDTGKTEVGTNDAKYPPEHYMAIKPLPALVAWYMMRDFSELLPTCGAKEELIKAIKLPHPFRHFKNVLISNPEVEKAWSTFRQEARRKLLEVWLENHEVEAELFFV